MTKEEIDEYLRYTRLNFTPERREFFSEAFQFDLDIIDAMQVGADPHRRAWVWPMFDGYGEAVGFRLRSVDSGAKFALKGSRSGIFMAGPHGEEDLWVVEGPTDVASLACLGMWAVGLPSINSGYGLVRDYVAESLRTKPRPVRIVWVCEGDSAGREYEHLVLRHLLRTGVPVVSVWLPPDFKDVRDCYLAGMEKDQLTCYADAQELNYG